jgi:membrane protein YdbS with pleckstrin-like domain
MAKPISPYVRLQRIAMQFVADFWHRRRTPMVTIQMSDWTRGRLTAAQAFDQVLVCTIEGAEMTIHAVPRLRASDVPYEIRPGHLEGDR